MRFTFKRAAIILTCFVLMLLIMDVGQLYSAQLETQLLYCQANATHCLFGSLVACLLYHLERVAVTLKKNLSSYSWEGIMQELLMERIDAKHATSYLWKINKQNVFCMIPS